MLDAAERTQVLEAWNDTAADVPGGSVAELVAAAAARVPDAIAVCCGGAYVSYRQLAGKAARLGGYLRAAGAGPETVVGLCLQRGPDLVTAIVGTWLAGAAYLPLDPDYPAGRLGFMLADSRAAIVAGTGEVLGQLPGFGGGGVRGGLVGVADRDQVRHSSLLCRWVTSSPSMRTRRRPTRDG